MGTFDGRIVVVTGGALGMGRGAAVAFAREGASVTIADVNAAAGQEAVEACLAAGREAGSSGKAIFVEGDVAQDAVCREVVRRTVEAFGGVDVLFNNVGIQPRESYANVENTSEEMWDRIIGVNLKSHFLMAKYAIPEMRRRGGGVIINNASVQGLQSMKGVPAYAASKGGVLSFTRQLALDYAAENIRVLAINPGTIDTELVRASARLEPDGVESALKRYGQTHPLGRIGTAEEVANVVLFLASDKASFMTGENVCVDGGLMALGAWAGGAGASAAGDASR
jgi:NAD(P)-dependent dehydrogenase (short-subunit alcohol dehydrogenase family)